MNRRFLWIPILFLCFHVFGQNRAKRPGGGQGRQNITLIGSVIDAETSTPLEYATISVFSKRDSSIVAGGISDEMGKFSIPTRPGKLYAEVSFISYQTYLIDAIEFDFENLKATNFKHDLGFISLSADGVQLDQVEIRAERSEVQFSLDKKIFNVGKDLANRGGTAEDILDNVPSVTVDIEGNVSLRGSTGVTILVDGRPSSLIGISNTNGLRSLPANSIEKVEVITNPSARYQAEGMAGIINIILKKGEKSGWNGNIDLTGGIPSRYGISGNFNYRTGPLNWFANYGFNFRDRPGEANQYQEVYRGDTTFITDQIRDFKRKGISHNVRFGADYFFSPKESLTGSFRYRFSDEDNLNTLIYNDYVNDFPGNLVEITERTDAEIEEESNLEYSLNYRKEFSSREHTLTADIQFRDNSENETSDFVEKYFTSPGTSTGEQDLLQRSSNDEGQSTWLFQLDYAHPFSKDHKWEVGLRSSLRDINNDYLVEEKADGQWTNLIGLSNNFIYNENIHAAYGLYGNKVGKFGFQVGLRAELSDVKTELIQTNEINDRNYTDLFPSAHFNFELGNNNAIQLSYSRRVRRPRFWDLNPFFTFSDNRNFFSGNPNLDPEFTNSMEIGNIKYWDKGSLSASVYYRHTKGKIQRIKRIDSDGNTTTRPENLSEQDNIGLEFTFSYNPTTWWRLDGNTNFYRSITNGENLEQNFDSDDFSWFARLTNRIKIWEGSDLQVRFNYRGPVDNPQGTRNAMAMMDLGWSKDFLDNNLTLTLSVRDVFNSRKRSYEIFEEDFYSRGEFQWRSRSVSLNASYRINQKKQRQRGNRNGGGEDFEGGGEF
jgi:outer membrane receptor protein involved in Fe transport